MSGSSTVEPISTGVAEAFAAANPDFNYTVEGPGTGDGFKKFCAGETDISDASRKIKDEEAKACADAGIEYVELKVAYRRHVRPDLAPTTPPSRASRFADLYALDRPRVHRASPSGATPRRSPRSSAPTPSFPTPTSSITGPGEESGTFDSFVELALDDDRQDARPDRPRQAHDTRPDYTASANDNAIIDGIAGSDTSLGWVGFAFAEENKDKVKRDPGLQGRRTGPASRPTRRDHRRRLATRSPARLYIYVNKAKAAANPAVVAYVDYYLADGTIATVLETVPYVNLPADALAETRAAWDAAK